MKNYKIILIILGLFLMGSCKKDFLTVPPEGQITPNGYYSTPEKATQLINAIYNNLLQWDESTFSWIGISSITSDDANKGSSAGDTGADKDQLDNFTYTSTDFSCNEVWMANYRGIARANRALSILPGVQIDAKLKHRLIGEAKFLRAYFYFNMVRTFGGVPLIDTLVDPTNQAELKKLNVRAPQQDIYNLIISDLTYAKDSLYSRSEYETNDLGRVTKGSAAGLLSKVYMYLKDWQKAYDLSGEVINSGEYSLAPNYATMWRESGNNGPGSLFEIQAVGGPINLGVQGWSVVQGVRGQFGWGFNTPSKSLEDAYEPGDPRKAATIIFPGDTMWDGVVIIKNTPNPRYSKKAYVSRTQETFDGNDWESNKHVRILRYAEVLLIHAEAANELGKTTEALQSLNKVRQRAHVSIVFTNDQSALRLKIWHERRVELGMEGDRFFDLVRQGRAATVLGPLGFQSPKNNLFPIPQQQIDISGGTLTQNPGY